MIRNDALLFALVYGFKMSNQFDLNQELEVINIEDCLRSLRINNSLSTVIEVEYFYHPHRLGTRVPLFLLFDESSHWLVENITYFCKIGNVFSINDREFYGRKSDFISIICKIFQQYGSNYGIIIDFGRVSTEFLGDIKSNLFLKSEITCIVKIRDIDDGETASKYFPIINVNKAKTSSVQNPLILEALKGKFDLKCLDWRWQYEQTDEIMFSKLAFKNLEKWKNTDPIGKAVGCTKIIPMKLMLDGDDVHSPEIVLKKIHNVGLVMDLSNDRDSYNKSVLLKLGIEYEKIQIESKTIPSSADIHRFISKIRAFELNQPENYILVHCHYGYNRTGLMICAYLIEIRGLSVEAALEAFKKSRPPGIKHQNYIDKLYLRYSS